MNRTQYYKHFRAMELARDEKRPHLAGLPVQVSQADLEEFSTIAPRTAQWSYSAPGIEESDTSAYADALEACERVADATGVTHSYVMCCVPGILSVRAWR